MISAITQKPLRVMGTDWPYFMVPVSQLEEVRHLLESHGIHHSVLTDIISWNGAPFEAFIDLGHGADPQAVQTVLDSVPGPGRCSLALADDGIGHSCCDRIGEGQTMIDTTTKKPLRVETDGEGRSYIDLPATQVEEVRRLLESHGIRHWVLEDILSWNGGPFEAIIYLGRGADPQAVQTVLDSVP
jgi:hypothetical protein